MNLTGNLHKAETFLDENNLANYVLQLDDKKIELNKLINKKITIEYLNQINCIYCGRKTTKSFFQGYCWPCFRTLPQTDAGVLNPEKDMAHEGISRDMEWAKKFSLVDHYVYLSFTDAVKVGVTRHTQIPTRWIDQGAIRAIKLAKTPHRNLAGQIEVFLKQHFKDKTNYRKMLTGNEYTADLIKEKEKAANLLPENLKEYVLNTDNLTTINYPVEQYPKKIKSVNLEKTPIISGILTGIKAQYLIIDNVNVLNIRKYGGYKISLSY